MGERVSRAGVELALSRSKTMQAAKDRAGHRSPSEGRDRKSNADPARKRRTIEPVEGAQTGSEGLGYLEKPADDAKKGGAGHGK
jgi:hypothetical protein